MSKGRKLLYDVGYLVLGLIFLTSTFAFIFSYLRIGEFETIMGQIGRALSSEQQAQYELLTQIRIISGIIIIASTGVMLAMGSEYYNFINNPKWELKKGLLGGLLILPGGAFYLISEDITGQSFGLTLVILGLLAIVGNGLYLVVIDFEDETKKKNSEYCSNCGDNLSVSDSFCPSCGQKV